VTRRGDRPEKAPRRHHHDPAKLEDIRAMHPGLASTEVLVGFPEDTTERDKEGDDPARERGITNAALGYIHDQGVPEVGIPSSPSNRSTALASRRNRDPLTQAKEEVMPGLDLSFLTLDPMFSDTFDVVRRPESVGLNGRVTVPVPKTFAGLRGIVKPIDPGKLERKDDGQVVDHAISIKGPFRVP
jgi:hypothetical protein